MQYPGYNEGQVKFEEGSSFRFKIHNLLQLQDNNWYYVLVDLNGLKHFLPEKHYKHYNFLIGSEITCVIEKINCTGRIYLEPEHPHYQSGKEYSFTVQSSDLDNQVPKLFVNDIFENCIEIELKNSIEFDRNHKKQVQCLVKKVKKGIPILELITTSS